MPPWRPLSSSTPTTTCASSPDLNWWPWQNLPPALDVIDLHIDKLISDFKGLSNFEILQLQLKEFEKYFELSIAHIKPTLTVIHGVGEGVLKNEIHSILKTKDNVASFSDDYHPLYGNGATLIKFK